MRKRSTRPHCRHIPWQEGYRHDTFGVGCGAHHRGLPQPVRDRACLSQHEGPQRGSMVAHASLDGPKDTRPRLLLHCRHVAARTHLPQSSAKLHENRLPKAILGAGRYQRSHMHLRQECHSTQGASHDGTHKTQRYPTEIAQHPPNPPNSPGCGVRFRVRNATPYLTLGQ